MTARSFIAFSATAVISASLGWLGHTLMSQKYLTPGESIAAAWQTQLNILADLEGNAREPAEVTQAAISSFSSLSTGLALHYDQLSQQQKTDVAKLINRANRASSISSNAPLQEILDCIKKAAGNNTIDRQCVANAAEKITRIKPPN